MSVIDESALCDCSCDYTVSRGGGGQINCFGALLVQLHTFEQNPQSFTFGDSQSGGWNFGGVVHSCM